MRLLLSHFLLLVAGTVFSQQPASDYKIDTSKVAILPATEYVSRPIQATLTNDEIQLAEKLVSEAFEKMGRELKRSECESFSYMALYKRQYFSVIENEQRIVYVNCFIDNENEFPYWKKYAAIVFDRGGFVHIKLNLTKNECISFVVSRSSFSKLKVLKPTVSITSL